MTRAWQAEYEPPAPADFERVVLGLKLEPHGHNPAATRLVVTANLVATNASTFKRLAADALESGARTLVVDLARCPYVDSVGLGVLVSIANAAKRAAKTLVVEHANDDLRTLFDLTQLSNIFEVR